MPIERGLYCGIDYVKPPDTVLQLSSLLPSNLSQLLKRSPNRLKFFLDFLSQYPTIPIGVLPCGSREVLWVLTGLIPHHVYAFLNAGSWGQETCGYYGPRVVAEPYTKSTHIQQAVIDEIHQEANALSPDTLIPMIQRPWPNQKPPDILCHTCGLSGHGPFFDAQAKYARKHSCIPRDDKSIIQTDAVSMSVMEDKFPGLQIFARHLAQKK
ncbi:MAG: hypothetical protein V1922_04890 [bacterium]